MPVAPYHHGHLRQALLEAAVDAARRRGPDGLVLRELARHVGVSHNAAYRHFADRGALIDVVAEHAMAGLVAAMENRLSTVRETDPVARARHRLIELGAAYVDFALDEPGLFRVLFTAYPHAPTASKDSTDPYSLLNAALDELVDVGYLDPAHRPGAEIGCWSAVHGFAVLHIEGPLRGAPNNVRERALRSMLGRIDLAYGARETGAVSGHNGADASRDR